MQPRRVGARDHVARLVAADRRRRKRHVLGQLEQHAAAAGHGHQAHFRIAMQAEHELQAAADLLADQHAVELFDAGAPDVGVDARIGRSHRRRRRQDASATAPTSDLCSSFADTAFSTTG